MTLKEEVSDVEIGSNETNDKNDAMEGNATSTSNTLKGRNRISVGVIVAIVIAVSASLSTSRKKDEGVDISSISEHTRTPEEVKRNMFQFEEIKLPVSLPEFNSDILSGYTTCAHLKEDIEQALNDYANILIEEDMNNVLNDDARYYGVDQPMAMAFDSTAITSNSASETSNSEKGPSPDPSSITEDSFGSNNQHEDVDEADIVKSDGTYVYTVYGMEIVVLDINAKEVFRLDLSNLNDHYSDDIFDDGLFDDGITLEKESTETVSTSDPEPSSSFTTNTTASSNQRSGKNNDENRRTSVMYNYPDSIRALLLHENRLFAILSGYNYIYRSLSPSTTKIVTIDIDLSTGVLSIVNDGNDSSTSYTSINGDFMAARLIDSYAHIVTTAYISHWEFSRNLSRYSQRYLGLDDIEYAKAAIEIAEKLIPKYASQMIQELIMMDDSLESKANSEMMTKEKKNLDETMDNIDIDTMLDSLPPATCKHIAKLSTYQNGKDENENLSGLQGILNGFVRVFSFDTQYDPADSENTSISATFVPTEYADVYATSDMIFLGGRGWIKTNAPIPFEKDESNVEDLPPSDVTYITAFQLEGATAIPKATGVIPGYTLNQFSFDYFEGHLRVATSTSAVQVWNEKTWESKIIRESTNQIIVAQIQDSNIQIVGTLEDLGITERIYAVRFLGNSAFMVTFRQTDPFFAIDLSVPTNPDMRGELKIPGFSNYLHPIRDEYILAVGQDADERGRQLGLQIALFDVSDLDNPQQIAKHVVKKWSSSASQQDHFAFRYLPLSQKLILPISTIDFDGFHVFDINPPRSSTVVTADEKSNTLETKVENGITFDFAISHFDLEDDDSNEFKCYGFNYLTPRSLVFQGDVMTLKGHAVLRHELGSGERLSRTDLDSNLSSKDGQLCYGWYLW